MRSVVRFILFGLLIGTSGCTYQQSLGEPIDDDARRAALLRAYPRPEVPKAVFQTLIRWGRREIFLTEVVEASPEGGVSVAGITDIGSTLYAARIDAEGHGRVVSNSLPFSDRWLLEGLIAELLIPWNEPDETCRLYRRPDDTYVLACKEGRTTRRFIFDGTGTYRQFHRLRGSRLLSRAILEWDDGTIPKTIRIDNPGRHYEVTREHVAGR